MLERVLKNKVSDEEEIDMGVTEKYIQGKENGETYPSANTANTSDTSFIDSESSLHNLLYQITNDYEHAAIVRERYLQKHEAFVQLFRALQLLKEKCEQEIHEKNINSTILSEINNVVQKYQGSIVPLNNDDITQDNYDEELRKQQQLQEQHHTLSIDKFDQGIPKQTAPRNFHQDIYQFFYETPTREKRLKKINEEDHQEFEEDILHEFKAFVKDNFHDGLRVDPRDIFVCSKLAHILKGFSAFNKSIVPYLDLTYIILFQYCIKNSFTVIEHTNKFHVKTFHDVVPDDVVLLTNQIDLLKLKQHSPTEGNKLSIDFKIYLQAAIFLNKISQLERIQNNKDFEARLCGRLIQTSVDSYRKRNLVIQCNERRTTEVIYFSRNKREEILKQVSREVNIKKTDLSEETEETDEATMRMTAATTAATTGTMNKLDHLTFLQNCFGIEIATENTHPFGLLLFLEEVDFYSKKVKIIGCVPFMLFSNCVWVLFSTALSKILDRLSDRKNVFFACIQLEERDFALFPHFDLQEFEDSIEHMFAEDNLLPQEKKSSEPDEKRENQLFVTNEIFNLNQIYNKIYISDIYKVSQLYFSEQLFQSHYNIINGTSMSDDSSLIGSCYEKCQMKLSNPISVGESIFENQYKDRLQKFLFLPEQVSDPVFAISDTIIFTMFVLAVYFQVLRFFSDCDFKLRNVSWTSIFSRIKRDDHQFLFSIPEDLSSFLIQEVEAVEAVTAVEAVDEKEENNDAKESIFNFNDLDNIDFLDCFDFNVLDNSKLNGMKRNVLSLLLFSSYCFWSSSKKFGLSWKKTSDFIYDVFLKNNDNNNDQNITCLELERKFVSKMKNFLGQNIQSKKEENEDEVEQEAIEENENEEEQNFDQQKFLLKMYAILKFLHTSFSEKHDISKTSQLYMETPSEDIFQFICKLRNLFPENVINHSSLDLFMSCFFHYPILLSSCNTMESKLSQHHFFSILFGEQRNMYLLSASHEPTSINNNDRNESLWYQLSFQLDDVKYKILEQFLQQQKNPFLLNWLYHVTYLSEFSPASMTSMSSTSDTSMESSSLIYYLHGTPMYKWEIIVNIFFEAWSMVAQLTEFSPVTKFLHKFYDDSVSWSPNLNSFVLQSILFVENDIVKKLNNVIRSIQNLYNQCTQLLESEITPENSFQREIVEVFSSSCFFEKIKYIIKTIHQQEMNIDYPDHEYDEEFSRGEKRKNKVTTFMTTRTTTTETKETTETGPEENMNMEKSDQQQDEEILRRQNQELQQQDQELLLRQQEQELHQEQQQQQQDQIDAQLTNQLLLFNINAVDPMFSIFGQEQGLDQIESEEKSDFHVTTDTKKLSAFLSDPERKLAKTLWDPIFQLRKIIIYTFQKITEEEFEMIQVISRHEIEKNVHAKHLNHVYSDSCLSMLFS